MNVEHWLKQATMKLQKAGIATARLDCLVLLEDVLTKDRAYLLAHPETPLTTAQSKRLDSMIRRRANHEPLAYIRGKTDFYGRTFSINTDVLEPRPESETMIDALKELAAADPIRTVIDIGTGSGALAITAKLELPHTTHVKAVDIDPKCLRVAQKNAGLLSADVEFLEGDLLAPITGAEQQAVALLCNLPYVPDSYKLNTAAEHEPRLAIFGGKDGLDVYRQLFGTIQTAAIKPMYILTESLPFQHQALRDIAQAHGYSLHKTDDFIQVFLAGV